MAINITTEQIRERALGSLGERTGTLLGAEDTGQTLACLGLDSLAALRWRQDIHDEFGVELPLSELTGSITAEQIIERIRDLAADSRHGVERSGEAPAEPTELTTTQQAYWSGRGRDFPGGGVATFWYNEYDRGPEHRGGRDLAEDLHRLETAWKRVVAHHEMLRTVIDRDAHPVVVRHDVRDWTMPRHDLRDLSPDQAEQEAATLRSHLSHQLRPTDEWPLVDVVAILLPGDRVRLCIGFDALVTDFASWGIVMRHWGTLVQHPHSQLAPAPITFGQALAARSTDTDRRLRRGRDRRWWRECVIPPAPLPQASFPVSGTRFRRRRRTLDAGMWSAIRAHGRQRGISPTSVALTAFAIACHRWMGPAKGGLTLNLTVFDRPDDLPEVVGDFSSTALLPLIEDSGFAPQSPRSFAELATAANRSFWEVLDHRSYSGVEVAQERPGEGPWPIVFTSALGLSSGTDDRWLGERIFGVSQTPQVLWDHLLWEEDDALVLVHDVVEDVMDDQKVEGLIAMEKKLLESLTTDRGWERPAPGWDPTGEIIAPAHTARNTGPLLHDPWLSTMGDHADAPALLTATGSITHRELARRAEQVAAGIAGHGTSPGGLVLVALPKGVEQVTAVLGTMLAGTGYVPVDPAWPLTRLTTIRDRTGLDAAIAGESVPLPDGVQRVGTSDGSASRTSPLPTDLAYVIFTSGSTGEPKGVAIEHRQARTTIDEINARFGIGAADRVLALSALSFDLSVYDIFGVLGAGGAMVLPDPDRLRDPQHWLDLMAQHRVSVWNSAPPMMEMLLEYAESVPDRAQKALAGLRHCLLSGDWIPVTLPDRLRALAPRVLVHSLGGATEASIWSITHPIGEVKSDWASIPYGRPLAGQSFCILDPKGEPTIVGGPGELHIGGAGVARGYVGAPVLTAERFIDRPDLDTRLYRTGDLGRWLADGSIEFLGRMDRQVKIGGHRIELGEIEAALTRLPEVRQAVASSVPGPDGRPRLVAHVSGNAGQWGPVSAEQNRIIGRELSDALRAQLPEYMIPTRFLLMEELPMTENGKVDHKSLPNPYARSTSTVDVTKTTEPPAPPQGQIPGNNDSRTGGLREAVLDLLGSETSLDVSLAAGGITSLQMVRLANLVEDHGLPRPTIAALLAGTDVETLISEWERDLQTAPRQEVPDCVPAATRTSGSVGRSPDPADPGHTNADSLHGTDARSLSDLSSRLRRAADLLDEAATEITAIAPLFTANGVALRTVTAASRAASHDTGTVTRSADLTEMQLAYLLGRAPDEFGRTLAPHFYTEALVTDLDPDRLQAAWDRVVALHPLLRATLTEGTRQQIHEQAQTPIEFLDQRSMGTAAQQRFREEVRAERSHRQLSVQRAPMAELLAVRLDERTWRLHLDLDLLFCDAASAATWIGQVAELHGKPGSPLAAPASHFLTWAKQDVPDEEARHFWTDMVMNLPDPVAPPLEPHGGPAHFVRRRHELDPQRWRLIREVAAEHKVTVTCLLLDALGEVLSPNSPGTIMLTLSRRPPGHESVVGDYTGTMPTVIGPIPGGLAARQEQLAHGLEHALGPGGVHGNEILRMLRSAGRPCRLPVAVSCALESNTIDPSQLLDCLGRTEYAISQTPQVLVDVQLFDVDGRLVCNIDADESVLAPAWIDRIFAAWIDRLAALSSGMGRQPRLSPTEAADRVRADVDTVFARLLGTDAPEDHRTWFDQGATSLTLVEAQRLLHERGYRIDIIDLFAHPTPAGTVAHLLGRRPVAAKPSARHAPLTGTPREHRGSAALAAAERRGRRRRMAR